MVYGTNAHDMITAILNRLCAVVKELKKGRSCPPLPEYNIAFPVCLVVPPCAGFVPDAGIAV